MFLGNLYTNTKLYIMNLTESPMCYMCGNEHETIIHVLDRCTQTRRFWERLKLWVYIRTGINLDFELKDVLFDTDYVQQTQKRLIWLICKAYEFLYKCKNREVIPTFENFYYKIKYVEQMERIYAERNNKMTDHYLKWIDLINDRIIV